LKTDESIRNENYLMCYQHSSEMLQNEIDFKTCNRNQPEGRSNRSPEGPGFKTGFTLGC